jgi:choline dehydrogenase
VNVVPEHAFQVHVDLMRPKSRGFVRARSDNPRQPPAIQFNYLQDTSDREDFRQSVRLVREIIAQPAMKNLTGEELFPGAKVDTDDAIDAWVRQAVETCYHPVGTCAMGNNAMSVVDQDLHVHGLDGLRVVDASIMPMIVSGNTNAPTIMIAEKASDMILDRAPPVPSTAPVWISPNWETRQR